MDSSISYPLKCRCFLNILCKTLFFAETPFVCLGVKIKIQVNAPLCGRKQTSHIEMLSVTYLWCCLCLEYCVYVSACERVLEKGQRERHSERYPVLKLFQSSLNKMQQAKIAISLLRLSWRESAKEHGKESSHNDSWSAGEKTHTVYSNYQYCLQPFESLLYKSVLAVFHLDETAVQKESVQGALLDWVQLDYM